MIENARGKLPNLPKTLNQSTGKVSAVHVAFNDDGWGQQTCSFTHSAIKIVEGHSSKFSEIEQRACEFTKKQAPLVDTTSEVQDTDTDDEDDRAHLADNDDSDDSDGGDHNCK